MTFPTIIGLEQAVQGQKDYLTLIEQDRNALQRLEALQVEAQGIQTPELEEAINHSFETIVATTPTLMEGYSLESASDQTVMQRIANGIKMLIEAVVRNVKRLYAWISDVILRSKGRRDTLNAHFKDLNKALGKQAAHITYQPIFVTPQQASLIYEDGQVPVEMSEALKQLNSVFKQYREGKSARTVVELAKIVSSGELHEMNLDVVFKRVDAIFKSSDITQNQGARRRGGTAWRQPIVTLLGNATIWLKTPNAQGSKDYGYEVSQDEFAPPRGNVTIDITDPAMLKACVSLNLTLMDELNRLSDQIAATRPHLKLATQVLEGINKRVDFSDASDKLQEIQKAIQLSDIVIKAMSLFPSQLYMHGMKVASSQAVLLKAIVKIGS